LPGAPEHTTMGFEPSACGPGTTSEHGKKEETMSVTRLGHIGLVVTDLDAYARFLVDGLGLTETRRESGRGYYALGTRHHQLRVTEGDAHACDGIGFDVSDSDALGRFRAAVEDAGLEVRSERPYDDTVADGFSFDVPHGPTIELCVGAALAPPTGRYPHDYYHARGDHIRLRKLGHVTIGTPEADQVERVFVDVLGFRISDRFPGVIAWTRCNRDHHSIGIAPAEAPGIHHMAFEIESFAHYERLADHLALSGWRLVWGPGRHGPGNNLFVYFDDPGGTMVEIYANLVQIENEDTYEPAEWNDLQEVGNRWGPLPDESWFKKLTPFTVPAGVE
jgi:catechol-2,3-dioxygenase